MKSLAIILFIAAVISFVSGVFACCGKNRNITFRNSGKGLIIIAVLKVICGFIALGDFPFAIIFLTVGSVLINAVNSFIRIKGDE